MTSTLNQLRQQWTTPCPSMAAVREHYFPHIRTDRRFRELVRDGAIKLKLTKLHNSARAQYVVYLTDLAKYLDALEAQTA
ncbi:pyocin activator PrtN family protein [Pseudomonas sp. 5P_5.1_Bac1]|uniref:pyocin activator PrtN family protein n=1 Tax=Pseudomonas sp. 5P_5.1_Bac1 TaxID=2971616 RepID=UPI0021C8B50E|nr:pyocin activator PrtN family protein [Pseudomonas sp. 5P_5.1_Bac1]MCU1722408.1 pyocin activator PrtN family protein [Pseudomonas sp. 5P_5.1_Bac1]